MKFAQMFSAGSARKTTGGVLIAALAVVMSTVACSNKSKSAVMSPRTVHSNEAAAPRTSVPAVAQPALLSIADKSSSPMKPAAPQLVIYRSRDYGVSFLYPWQYAFTGAKGLAEDDEGQQAKSDGHGAQFTLARIEIPRGYYPDTDFENGYFTLSLNEDISEQECQSMLNGGKDGKLETETINGIEFHWKQTESGGHGSASTLRNYTAFTNGTCYEVEMGVKTKNERGRVREVDAGQVMHRLDRILRSLKIESVAQNVAGPQPETPAESPSGSEQ